MHLKRSLIRLCVSLVVVWIASATIQSPLARACGQQLCRDGQGACDPQDSNCLLVPTSLLPYSGQRVASGWFGASGKCGTKPCLGGLTRCACGKPLANQACDDPTCAPPLCSPGITGDEPLTPAEVLTSSDADRRPAASGRCAAPTQPSAAQGGAR